MLSTSERPSFIFDDYPDDWPSEEFYVNQGAVTREQYYGLKALIENGATETEVESFFNENQPALALVLTFFQTGHHASWIVPKRTIRARLSDTSPGLRPDSKHLKRGFLEALSPQKRYQVKRIEESFNFLNTLMSAPKTKPT